ncbi:zinc ribbon domain-containing protein [Cytophaga aurantiaca]|uniref:zinc ribbon domain-containing protein n=1 Tax=Cytophaga aurantiaca TaxID=29530 RepID=UPI000364123D|nr:C4-type zinc ribbon domain-containing protein [Cytophaga aurantiaca]
MEQSTIAQKLDALVKLQSIDSKLDEIIKVRGDLPEEVRDLEDELAGYETRLAKHEGEITTMEEGIKNLKNGIKESEKLIKKYEEQQKNVRNNREFDAISKEVELQQLEMQVSDKKIKEALQQIEFKKEEIKKTDFNLSERRKDLENKKEELEVIVSESQDEEVKLNKEREKASKQIEERLLNSYTKLVENYRNRLAVVSVKRNACGGCFNTVPPQRQGEIRERKKIIVCEHCGRILANVEFVMETLKK